MKIGSVALVAALTAATVSLKNVDAFVVTTSSSPSLSSRMTSRSPSKNYNHVPLAAATALQMSSYTFDDTVSDEEEIRSAYVQWCQEHGKTPSEERFGIFAQNYQAERNLLLDMSQSNQIVLNEYADWTVEEYEQREQSMETRIQTIYQNWCIEYSKTASMDSYTTFRDNFLQNMKHYEDTGDFYRLNEYADMTKDEYDAMVMKMMMMPPSSELEAEDDVSYSSAARQVTNIILSFSCTILMLTSILVGFWVAIFHARNGPTRRCGHALVRKFTRGRKQRTCQAKTCLVHANIPQGLFCWEWDSLLCPFHAVEQQQWHY